MPKLKTKKAIRKRFKFSSTGLLKCKPAAIRHRLTSKNSDRNRQCFAYMQVDKSDFYRLRKYVHCYIK